MRTSIFGAIGAAFAPLVRWRKPKLSFVVPRYLSMFDRLRSNEPMTFSGGDEIRSPFTFKFSGWQYPDKLVMVSISTPGNKGK